MRTPQSSPAHSRGPQPVAQGYRPAVSQPAGSLAISWRCPPELLRDPARALQQLDAWLCGPLDVALLPEPGWALDEGQDPPQAVRCAAWRILQLAGELLRLIHVPVFDPGVLEQIAPDPEVTHAWRLQVRVPIHDQQPRLVYSDTYARSARLISLLLVTPLEADAIRRIQAQIESEQIERLSPFIVAAHSTIPLLEAAHQRGIPFRHLGAGFYQLGWGSRARRIKGGANDLDAALGSLLSHNKRLTATLLSSSGLPVPLQQVAATTEQALAAARRLGWPVVLKPADRDRGEGVSVDITTPEQLEAAWHSARQLSANILVEKHVAGVCHRLHVMAGQVISVSRRLPKSVCGDGHHSVRQLIAIANQREERRPPWRRRKPFPQDALASTCLERHGLSLDAVPAAGQWAPLRPFSSIPWGGVLENCTETVHPDNVAAAVRAARICQLSNAGIDMISQDISVPWHHNGAVINEVNFGPQTRPAEGFEFMLERILGHHFPHGGRIPISVYLGGPRALSAAVACQQQLIEQGAACALTASDRSVDGSGEPQIMAAVGLFHRCLALLGDPGTEALVVAVQTAEWLHTGLPFDRADQVIDCGDPLLDSGSWAQPVARARLMAMLQC